MAEQEGEDNVLNYAAPAPLAPPLKRRDSSEYYREPPSIGFGIAIVAAIIFVIVYVLLGFLGIVRLPIG